MQSPPQPVYQHPGVYSSHTSAPNQRRTETQDESLFKWVSLKELIFVFAACSIVVVLIRAQDRLDFNIVLTDNLSIHHYSNKKFPVRGEKILPIVTDLESDGHTDIVLVTPDQYLKVYSTEPRPSNIGPKNFKYTTKNISLVKDLGEGTHVVAIGTGFIEPYQSMIQVRRQVIVVLTSDWTVACYSNRLKRKWMTKVSIKEASTITGEAAVFITPFKIKNSDLGSVIVGGRINIGRTTEDSFTRKRRGAREENEEHLLRSLGHYSTYGLEGSSGDLRWKHEPGDFEAQPAYDTTSTFVHIKLSLHKYMNHQGEVSWHQYSSAIRNVLPHSWYEDSDSYMEIAHFSKDRKKTDQPLVSEHLTKVGDLAMNHLAGYAFGGMRPHSPEEHVEKPNVIVIHSMKGLEVLHLYTGRPLFSLPLSPAHAVHGDINADGIVEHVHAIVNPGEDYEPGTEITKHEDIDCYGQALPLSSGSKTVFRHSICKASHWTESFIATEKWLPNLNKMGRKKVNHAVTEPFTPVLIESASHQHPLKLASLRQNAAYEIPLGIVYDSVFVLSSGRVTSIGPGGQFNWQVDTGSDWDQATNALYSTKEVTQQSLFSTYSFTPSSLPYALQTFTKKTHVLLIGWVKGTVLNSVDGTTAAEFKIPCPPVLKAVIADFTDDGINDVIIVCSDRVLGYSPEYRSGFWHNTALSLFVGLVIVIVAVYTRQQTGFLMPKKKQATE